jgi:hypothetical protein
VVANVVADLSVEYIENQYFTLSSADKSAATLNFVSIKKVRTQT